MPQISQSIEPSSLLSIGKRQFNLTEPEKINTFP